jgi:hypothetical protein
MVIVSKGNFTTGDYIRVKIQQANAATLFGNVVSDVELASGAAA